MGEHDQVAEATILDRKVEHLNARGARCLRLEGQGQDLVSQVSECSGSAAFRISGLPIVSYLMSQCPFLNGQCCCENRTAQIVRVLLARSFIARLAALLRLPRPPQIIQQRGAPLAEFHRLQIQSCMSMSQ